MRVPGSEFVKHLCTSQSTSFGWEGKGRYSPFC